jgi:cytochrome b subunit of formate dehydrogenase
MSDWTAYEHDLDQTVIRFTLAQRVQHIALIVIFTVLILTGLPLLLPGIGTHVVDGAFSLRTALHHFAGAGLLLLGIFHVVYVVATAEGRADLWRLIPRLQDVRDVWHHMRYQLGKTDTPPPFDKYDPFEKFEYLAVVWGSVVMVITGFMMWFFETTLHVFPKWVYDVILAIHGYEAVLAFLAIILWHLYSVHLRPGVFPMSRVWLDGKITLAELKAHHPKEFERWLSTQRLQAPASDAERSSADPQPPQ